MLQPIFPLFPYLFVKRVHHLDEGFVLVPERREVAALADEDAGHGGGRRGFHAGGEFALASPECAR